MKCNMHHRYAMKNVFYSFFLFPSHPYLKVSHFYFCFHTSHVASRIEYLKVTGTTGTSSNEHAFNRSHPRTTHHAFAPTRTILCLRFFFGNKSYLKSIWTRSDNASFSVDACQWGVNKVVILFIMCWWMGTFVSCVIELGKLKCCKSICWGKIDWEMGKFAA